MKFGPLWPTSIWKSQKAAFAPSDEISREIRDHQQIEFLWE
jgi:hypothetical protein